MLRCTGAPFDRRYDTNGRHVHWFTLSVFPPYFSSPILPLTTTMDPETRQRESSYVYNAASKAIASLAPIGNIYMHLCGFHFYAYVEEHGRTPLEKILVRTTLAMWRPTTSVVKRKMTFTR